MGNDENNIKKKNDISKNGFSKYYDKQDAYLNLDRIISWINNCDTKTSILIAFVAAIIAIFASSFENITYLASFNAIENKNTCQWLLAIFIVILLIVLLALLVIIIKNIYIALQGKIILNKYNKKYLNENEIKNHKKGSLLFFQAIANYQLDEFIKKETDVTDKELFDDISIQIYYNAKRCTEKFTHYNYALRASIALFLDVIFLLILSFLH